MSKMVLLSDQEIVAMPVSECGEPLVDMRRVDALRLDPRLADGQGAFAHLRMGVVDRLVTAQSLLPPGLRLLIVEGYRPPALQSQYFTGMIDRIRGTHPDREESWYFRRASHYVSPPEVAPHVAGGAVDLTLCDVNGTELWMGTEVNYTDTEICHMDSTDIDTEAQKHRLVLSNALRAAGLVNYPTEWWHWSYGERYWAYSTNAPAARYGPVQLPN